MLIMLRVFAFLSQSIAQQPALTLQQAAAHIDGEILTTTAALIYAPALLGTHMEIIQLRNARPSVLLIHMRTVTAGRGYVLPNVSDITRFKE